MTQRGKMIINKIGKCLLSGALTLSLTLMSLSVVLTNVTAEGSSMVGKVYSTPSRGDSITVEFSGASPSNPIYIDVRGVNQTITTPKVTYSHTALGNLDVLKFNSVQIYKEEGCYNSLCVTSGDGTQGNRYIFELVNLTPISGSVTLSGVERVGSQLTATYDYPADKTSSDYTVEYEWYRIDGTSATELKGSGDTYTLVDEDKNKSIKVVVKVDNSHLRWTNSDTEIAATSGTIAGAGTVTITYTKAQEISGSVTLSGTEKVGQQLTATYTAGEGTVGTDFTIKYEWYRVDGTESNPINSTTENKYTLGDADKGKNIKVIVKVDDGKGIWKDNATDITAMSDTISVFSDKYSLTFPANTTVPSADFTELTDGLKITGSDFSPDKKVVVTASSANGWIMKASGVTSEIRYDLLAKSTDTARTTSFEFDKDAIEAGTAQKIGVKANASDIDNAKGGVYTDTITFTADIVNK